MFGPTAAGKSALAHAAASSLGGEIVVADPFQRYRGLEIAADSPTRSEQEAVRYHFVGDLALDQSSSAGDFARLAHAAIDDILARGRVPIVSGGTGLYLRAALAELTFPAPVPAEVRLAVEALVGRDLEAALAELSSRDPESAGRVDPRNARRVARALELARVGVSADRPRHELWNERTRRRTTLVGLLRPRSLLDRLIAQRVRRELADGLVAELEAALDTPGLSREAAQIIGMREVAALRDGAVAASELPELLAARTRRLARAQLTWLRRSPGFVTLDLGEHHATGALAETLAVYRKTRGRDGQVRSGA